MRTPRRLAATLVTAAACAAVAAPAPAQTSAGAPTAVPAPPGPPTVEGSWTARILYPVAARRTPGGAVVARLMHYAEFSTGPSVLMVTDRKVVRRKVWIRILLPKRPNGTNGWVPADAVELRRIKTRIKVSVSRRTVQVMSAGKVVKTFRAAVGTGGTPTPKGLHAIYDSVRTNGQLGPYILVLTAHSNVLRTFAGGDGIVGIHGWPTSAVLGQAVSHGCVRMSRDGVRTLAAFAKAGVPVHVAA
jgi:lipoprotein-anchoring transpeptidase ErfK/SrfK